MNSGNNYAGTLGIYAGHFDQIIHCEIGKIFLRDNTFLCQHPRGLIIHALQGQQILDVVFKSFFGRDCLRQQRVACTAA